MSDEQRCVVCGSSSEVKQFSRAGIEWGVCQRDINAVAIASTLPISTVNIRAEKIIELIKMKRDEYRDKQIAAGPGTTDQGVIDSAQQAWEFAEEYDRLLAEIDALV
jgi:hypothetical protein